MKFDFETYPNRHGKDSLAVDSIGTTGPGAAVNGMESIPMWIADMNFATAPSITEAIAKRLSHPLFGYYEAGDEYYNAIIGWQKRRNGVEDLAPENIAYENGVLGGVITALRELVEPGAKVLVHSPTYIGFTHCLTENGYEIVHSPLKEGTDGLLQMDYEDMERKLSGNDIKVAIICSPHNPSGRVWEQEELARAMEVYERHNVWIISDEIWSDIILNGHKHCPTQSASEYARTHTIALYSLTKTFNLAGFASAYHIIYNKELAERITANGKATYYNSMNVLSKHALLGAYTPTGEEWLTELRTVLSNNVNLFCGFFAENFPEVKLMKPQGTYMLFPDFTEYCAAHNTTVEEILKAGWDCGVAWQDGRPFHGENSIRVNVALPTAKVQEALDRIKQYVLK